MIPAETATTATCHSGDDASSSNNATDAVAGIADTNVPLAVQREAMGNRDSRFGCAPAVPGKVGDLPCPR